MGATLKEFYCGDSSAAKRFRLGLLFFDIAVIVFFVASSFMERSFWLRTTELAIGAILVADFTARWTFSPSSRDYFSQLSTWGDVVVLLTLIPPFFTNNLLFLRMLRAVRLFRSYHVFHDLREHFGFFRKNADAIEASINLLVFIFISSALVFVAEGLRHPKIQNFIDALYFTVSTLTTTGFGDITFTDMWGRLLSIFIMIAGVGLFLRLVQAIFRPTKVNFECPTCGLNRHDLDAVHCKHCGLVLHIVDEGLDG